MHENVQFIEFIIRLVKFKQIDCHSIVLVRQYLQVLQVWMSLSIWLHGNPPSKRMENFDPQRAIVWKRKSWEKKNLLRFDVHHSIAMCATIEWNCMLNENSIITFAIKLKRKSNLRICSRAKSLTLLVDGFFNYSCAMACVFFYEINEPIKGNTK